jgi:hypothetical protein
MLAEIVQPGIRVKEKAAIDKITLSVYTIVVQLVVKLLR